MNVCFLSLLYQEFQKRYISHPSHITIYSTSERKVSKRKSMVQMCECQNASKNCNFPVNNIPRRDFLLELCWMLVARLLAAQQSSWLVRSPELNNLKNSKLSCLAWIVDGLLSELPAKSKFAKDSVWFPSQTPLKHEWTQNIQGILKRWLRDPAL